MSEMKIMEKKMMEKKEIEIEPITLLTSKNMSKCSEPEMCSHQIDLIRLLLVKSLRCCFLDYNLQSLLSFDYP